MPRAVVSVHKPALSHSHISLAISVTVHHTENCRATDGPFGLDPGNLLTFQISFWLVSPLMVDSITPLLVCWFLIRIADSTPRRCHHRLSSTAFHAPVTTWSIRAWLEAVSASGRINRTVVSCDGFSCQSILAASKSSRSSGFYPLLCYQASSALDHQYYP